MKEEQIIHQALENLEKETGIFGHWQENAIDGLLDLNINDHHLEYVVEVKREVRPHQLDQILQKHREFNQVILIAEHIYPRVKERLRELNFPYLEVNGNLYLKRDHVYVWIEPHRRNVLKKEIGNRAFTKTGLKVLFYLLLDNHHINLPQRVIAKEAGVALGNIPQVINGLKETGYLLQLDKKTYTWDKKLDLIDRWIVEYDTTLKPQLLIDQFHLPDDWKHLNLNHGEEVWGGEPAGEILTNYLRPEEFILFTKKKRMDFIKTHKLKPDNKGKLKVYEWFWKTQAIDGVDTVPPLLAYADLKLSNNKRCNETAEMIWNEHIEPNL